MQVWFDKLKTFSETVTMGYAPWWVVPVGVVLVLAIVF